LTCTCRPSRRLPSGGGGGRFNTPCQRSLKAMDPNPATQPCRLDPVEVSEWIYAHPSFRMRDVHECHPKKDPPAGALGILRVCNSALAQFLK
jgi:hypothetical protein